MTARVLLVCGSLQARSANRAALAVARARLLRRTDVVVDQADDLGAMPPFDSDAELDPPKSVVRFRDQAAGCDAALLAAPEYAGGLAGMLKNVLDWHVGGAGGLYLKPVGVLSAGTSGGLHARRQLAQTLTWQGAHVVADLGIAAPRTKTDGDGHFSHAVTITRIEAWADAVVDALALEPSARLARVEAVTTAVGVEPGHIAPL